MGWLPVPNPVAFTVFGLDIMWYGLCLTTGVVVGFIVLYNKASSRGLDKEHTLDLAIWCVPAGIIGARLYYVIFEWDQFKDDLKTILNIRGGGLAIHGAIIGGFGMAIILLLIWKKENVFDWVDMAILGLPIAQAIGRWGNYFNSEAHGVATTLPWAIYADGEWVHPTFLYESVWCFLLFVFLILFSKKAKYRGQLTCLYMIIYSAERFFVESLRTDSLYIGSFRQAQVISVGMIIIGVVGLVVCRRFPIPQNDAA